MRIVSLVPSQTELLADLGLDDEVVGITKFCVHPDHWFRSKMRVGGTKQLSIDRIRALQPDIVLANKEENVKEQVEALRSFTRVWVSNVETLPDAYDMIKNVGNLTGKQVNAEAIIRQIQQEFAHMERPTASKRVAYLIWREPYMSVGGDTFIHDMLQRAGYENVFGNKRRYPEVTITDIVAAKPDMVFLSSEPFPFGKKHQAELQELIPGLQTILVDGQMFSWYGSRLLKSPAYFTALTERIRNTE